MKLKKKKEKKKKKKKRMTDSVDRYEPSHQDLHCLQMYLFHSTGMRCYCGPNTLYTYSVLEKSEEWYILAKIYKFYLSAIRQHMHKHICIYQTFLNVDHIFLNDHPYRSAR